MEKITKALKISVIAGVPCTLTPEQCTELIARIAELEAEIQEYRCLCEDWALVETDDSIKLAMIEASKPEVNNE